MSDLQLNTKAFTKFNCLSRQNLAQIYAAAFTPNLFRSFNGILTLIWNWICIKFDFKKENVFFVDKVTEQSRRFGTNWFGDIFFFFACFDLIFTVIFIVFLKLYIFIYK